MVKKLIKRHIVKNSLEDIFQDEIENEEPITIDDIENISPMELINFYNDYQDLIDFDLSDKQISRYMLDNFEDLTGINPEDIFDVEGYREYSKEEPNAEDIMFWDYELLDKTEHVINQFCDKLDIYYTDNFWPTFDEMFRERFIY